MHVLLPSKEKTPGRVSVHEQQNTVLLGLLKPGHAVSEEVALTLPQAHKIAEHLNRICQRIAKRPPRRG